MSADNSPFIQNPFQGNLLRCIMCDKQLQHDPAVESNWRALQLDHLIYYVCPDHFPADGSSQEAFTDVFKPILLRAQAIHAENLMMLAIRRLMASGHAVNVRVPAKDLYLVIAAVQLAARHTAYAQSWPLRRAVEVCRSWNKFFKREIQDVLDLGWSPAHDQPITDPAPQPPPAAGDSPL